MTSTNDSRMRTSKPLLVAYQILWTGLLIGGLLTCLALSWALNRAVNYGYGFWYDQLQIEQHIDKYGPQNRYREGFESLSSAQHQALFAEIVDAIHDHGNGLESIRYSSANQPSVALLHHDEIVHLQDVANLVDVFIWVGVVALMVTLISTVILVSQRIAIRWRVQGAILVMLISSASLPLLIWGPKAVFYQMHIWIFPPGHPWFFYYQDSLMSTMMKAPDLFGGIAVGIVVPGLLLYGLAGFAAAKLLKRQ
ncbi:MAG: DUF1461 domain-containing protein [Oleibacter sp.]|nr:DUF1461 domain-containing protein [Thalassolituus sp.]